MGLFDVNLMFDAYIRGIEANTPEEAESIAESMIAEDSDYSRATDCVVIGATAQLVEEDGTAS